MNKKKWMMAGTLCSAAAASYLLYRENHKIDVMRFHYHDHRLPKDFTDFRIVQISDLHNAVFGIRQKHLLEAIEECQSDLIVITGDLIDQRRCTWDDMKHVKTLIEEISMHTPVIYIPGNHEARWEYYDKLKNYLFAHGIIVLEDRTMEIQRGNAAIRIAGLRDPKFYSHHDNAFLYHMVQLKKECGDQFSILLSHRPERFDEYDACGFDLVLCGHAHGGQIRLPKIGALYAPGQGLFPRYSEGMYQKKHSTMIVSRGLGNSRAPQRICNHPNINLVILEP